LTHGSQKRSQKRSKMPVSKILKGFKQKSFCLIRIERNKKKIGIRINFNEEVLMKDLKKAVIIKNVKNKLTFLGIYDKIQSVKKPHIEGIKLF